MNLKEFIMKYIINKSCFFVIKYLFLYVCKFINSYKMKYIRCVIKVIYCDI